MHGMEVTVVRSMRTKRNPKESSIDRDMLDLYSDYLIGSFL